MHDQEPSSQYTDPKLLASKPSAHFGKKLLWGVLGFVLVILLSLTWIFQSNSGSRFLFQVVQSLSSGRLQFHQVEGRLADQLSIDEVTYRDAQHKLVISGLQLHWQPWALWNGRLEVISLSASTVRIASIPTDTAPVLPASLRLPLEVHVQNLALGRLIVSQLAKNDQEPAPMTLTGIVVTAKANSDAHQISLQLNSDWGGMHLQGKMQTSRPFALNGDFVYFGHPTQNLPQVLLQGGLSGSLQELLLQAKSVQKSNDGLVADPQQQVNADLQLKLSPFAPHPLQSAKLSVQKLNPQWINPNAPNAMLDMALDLQPNLPSSQSSSSVQIKSENKKKSAKPDNKVDAEVASKADTKADTKIKTKASGTADPSDPWSLIGQISLRNSMTQTVDQHGLPVKSFESKIHWQGQHLDLSKIKIELSAGSILADAKVQFRPAMLPLIDSKLVLKDLDLAQLDSRLRQSRIEGMLQLQSKDARRIDFQAQLNELREPRASLNADASFLLNAHGDSGLLQFKRLELQADQARLNGIGEINFEGDKLFKFQAKLVQFNPAYWWKAPAGKLDGEMQVSGNLAPQLSIKLQLPSLSGELAGQKISASGTADWQQASLLKLDQFELQWGANKLQANGALGVAPNQLNLNLQADDLTLFDSLTGFPLAGKANVKATLSGKLDAPSTKLILHADDLRSSRGLAIGQLDADLQMGMNPLDPIVLQVNASQFKSTSIALNSVADSRPGQQLPIEKRKTLLERLQLSVQGTRCDHKIDLALQMDKTQQLSLLAQGGWILAKAAPAGSKKMVTPLEANGWSGHIEQLKLRGIGARVASHMPQDDLILQAPMQINLNSQKISVGAARFVGGFGKLALEQLDWTPQSLVTKGKLDEFPVMEVLKLVKPQESMQGDLRIGMQWDLQLKDNVRGAVNIARQSGDLTVLDADGTGHPMALGLSEATLQLQAGGLIAGSDAEQIKIQMLGLGSRMGEWRANLNTQIKRVNDKWTFSSEAPLKGELHANMPELQWLAGQFSADIAVKGALKLDAEFGGQFSKPTYQANLAGTGLELAFAAEGLLFPNGELRASLNQDILKLERLRFANKVTFVPKLEQFQDLNWSGREGEFSAAGEVNWRNQSGAIQANWKDFPLLQRKDRWLVVSGQANITQVERTWALIGKLRADAAYFKLPKLPPPSLSSDVLVSKGIKLVDEDVDLDSGKKGLKTKLDLQIDMGPKFVFVGRGLNTALTGTLRLRSNDGSPVHASGSIATNGGQYEGYGQQLEIERGILNFQGAPSNPSLNIRALRKGLPIEAGVDVTGTVANPQVRLVSEPNVPDSEKISWLVLGRESDQVGSADATLLLSAAGAIFGGDGSRNIPRELVQGLGFDEFSIGPAESGGSSKLPSQTVAGATAVGASSNDKVVNIGKRLRPGLVLSVERGMSDASGALKLSWQLSRRLRFIGRSGTDNSMDVKYSFSFN
ncbi:translocation/assembly module TamB domain-containing protein [Undibacterium sp. LX15W]|uniref:Translocation/assembly module TamB domain-containing protein n=2 Tax=Undibacterium flavidum TaxID=2762297 RepID=A0ABR6YDK0_9BURK|nr:translocation/assembly module TamB domain-containing protein [Undibacterium flavidum]